MPNIGAAISQGLESFLAQREASKRQAMLDDLAQKREARMAQADMDNHNEAMARINQHDADQQDKVHEEKIKKLVKIKDSLVPGDVLDKDTLDQMDAAGEGNAFPKPTSDTPGMRIAASDTGPTVAQDPAVRPYIGSPAQRTAITNQKKEEDLGKALTGVTDRKVATQIALTHGVPYSAVDDVVNTHLGKEVSKTLPPSAQEYEYYIAHLGPGEKPVSYGEYQTIDANRKKRTTPAADDAALLLTDAGLDMAAKLYAKTGQLPPMGMGKEGAKVRTRVINRASSYDSTSDTFHADNATPDVAGNKSDYQANSGAQAQLTKNLHAVQAFANTAKKNGQLLEETLKGLPDTGVTWLNQPLRSAANALGSEQMAQFNVLRQSVQTEYARTINNPNLTGVLSDTARKEIEKGLAEGATVGQFKAALKTFASEAGNRESSLATEISDIQKQIKGGAKESSSPATPKRVYYDATGKPVSR